MAYSQEQKTAAFPDLSESEAKVVEYDLRRYLELVKRIYEYVEKHDPKTLTELRRRANVTKEGGKRA